MSYYKSDSNNYGAIDPVFAWGTSTSAGSVSYLYAENNSLGHSWLANFDGLVTSHGIGVFIR